MVYGSFVILCSILIESVSEFVLAILTTKQGYDQIYLLSEEGKRFKKYFLTEEGKSAECEIPGS